MKKIVVFGAGGFGREVMYYLQEENPGYQILGFVDDYTDLSERAVDGHPVLGGKDWLLQRNEQVSVLVAIANPEIRRAIVGDLIRKENLEFPSFITRDVYRASDLIHGKGCIIVRKTVLTINVRIGNFFLCNPSCTIGHDAIIDDYVTLYPSVNISGNVHVENNVEVGVGSQILQGRTVGTGSILGAGAVVTKDIPSHCTAVGVPARIIKKRSFV